jgi:hypothetical protein
MAFSTNSLNLIPTDTLTLVSNALTSKASIQAAELSAEQARANRLEGKTEVATTDGGRSTVTLENSKKTVSDSKLPITGMASVVGLAKTLSDGGEEAYDPASLPPGTTATPADIDTLDVENSSELSSVWPIEFVNESVELQKNAQYAKVAESRQRLDETQESLLGIKTTLQKRASGELPNPRVNFSRVEDAISSIIDDLANNGSFSSDQIEELRQNLTDAASRDISVYEDFIKDVIVRPYKDNQAALAVIAAQLKAMPVDKDVPIFDTVFGPPISYAGKYILSEDGIYYDSRSGGIPYITAQKITSQSWELRYSSNRGGKGELYDADQISKFADTIFDDEYKNETGEVKNFYKYDDILQLLENDKNLQIMDVSAKITDLIASGYAASSAIIKNYEESYAGVAYTYDRKIIKRKKQLQVAALFGPFGVTLSGDPQGEGLFYTFPSAPVQEIIDRICGQNKKVETITYAGEGVFGMSKGGAANGAGGFGTDGFVNVGAVEREFIDRIPLNNFSYLKDIGLIPDVATQKTAMLHSSDLDDTTAPMPPTFLTQGPGSPYEVIPEMAMAPMAVTDWINTSGDTGGIDNVSGISGVEYIRRLDDGIVTDNLIVCYNFLEASAVVAPSSTDFLVRNYADGTGVSLAAKMVGNSASSIFLSGVTIPYLTGSLYKPGTKYGIRYSYLDASSGSYVRLPNNYRNNAPYVASQPIDDMMYNSSGWSMDFWAHTPDLSGSLTTAHRYKLVAANENCGESFTGSAVNPTLRTTTADMVNSEREHRVGRTKGMVIGWRDRGDPGEAPSGLQFVVLPTVAQNDPVWGKSVCIGETVSGDGAGSVCVTELGFTVDVDATSLSGYTIGQASGSFAHYAISCDTSKDTITLYVNGQFLASSLVSDSFGVRPGLPLNIPSRIGEGHFHDERGAHGEKLYNKFPVVPIFTPWILGGGFTDGIEHEDVPLFDTTFPGFLGTNTNNTYYHGTNDIGGGPFGQHSNGTTVAGLGGYTSTGSKYLLARSGLDGHLGSFKMYGAPLTKDEVMLNYNAQSPYFDGIKLPFRLL